MPSTPSELLRVSLGLCLLLSAACTEDERDIPASQLDFLELLPTFKRVEVGERFRLGVERVSGATTENVTAKVTLRSDDEAVLQIEDGVVRAIAPGTAHVTAEHDGETASSQIDVIAAVSAVELDLVDFWLAQGTSKRLGAVLIAGESKRAFDSGTWGSSDPGIASVDADGVVTGHKAGTADITLSRSGSTTRRAVRVEAIEPGSAQIVIASGKLVAKSSSALTVVGSFPGDLTQDLTELFELAVEGDSDVLKVSGSSLAAGDKAGTALVIAKGKADTIAAGLESEIQVEVVPASALQSVRIEVPEELALGMVETAFKVLGDYGVDIELATAPTELTVEPADVIAIRSSRGTVVPLKAAEAELTLKVTVSEGEDKTRDVETTQVVRVVDTALSRLSVSGPASRLTVGQALQLEATAHYDALEQTVTTPVLWTSADPAIAIVSNVQSGLVTALRAGRTTLQARYRDQSTEYELVVEE